jgi:hypothetical protein
MAWLDTVFKFIGYARYNSVTPALSSGQASELQCDSAGRLLVNNLNIDTLWNDAGAAASERVVKGGTGKVYQIFGRNTGASTKYIFLFNANARPANGSTGELFVPLRVEAGQTFVLTVERFRAFTTGLYWGVSSTDATFTYDATGAFCVATEYT